MTDGSRSTPHEAGEAAGGPDIVLVLFDQLSAKWLEAAQAGACPVPHLDRLAAEGVSFRRAITSNPVCCPARATLATGRTSRQHGVLQNGYALDPAIPTFMRLLQQAGRRTGCFGKLHLHPHFAGLRPDYSVYGFDVTRLTEDPRGGAWLDGVEAEYPEHYEAALATIWAGSIPEFAAYGPDRRDLRPRIRAAREGRDWTSPEVPDGDARHAVLPFPDEVSQTEWITRGAEAFIAETPPDRALFAHVGYVQPHSPFQAPAAYFRDLDDARIPDALPATWRDDPHHPRCWDGGGAAEDLPPERVRSMRRCYFADLAHLDAQVGRIRAALEAAGRWERTLLVVAADHGELLYDHAHHGKGNPHYDACVRVPLLVAGPGLRGGLVRDEFVQLEDLFPTFLDAAGLEAPAPPAAGPYLRGVQPARLPGRSLLPLCRGEAAPADGRDHAYAESYSDIFSCTPDAWARTVRTDRWRYTRFPGGAGEQLFDLERDPDELVNRVADPACRDALTELRERLLDAVILQDHPHPPRGLFSHGVH